MCKPYLNLDYPTVIDMSMITIIYSLILVHRQKCLLLDSTKVSSPVSWVADNKADSYTQSSHPIHIFVPWGFELQSVYSGQSRSMARQPKLVYLRTVIYVAPRVRTSVHPVQAADHTQASALFGLGQYNHALTRSLHTLFLRVDSPPASQFYLTTKALFTQSNQINLGIPVS